MGVLGIDKICFWTEGLRDWVEAREKLENYHLRKIEGGQKTATEQHKNMKISNSKEAIIQKP